MRRETSQIGLHHILAGAELGRLSAERHWVDRVVISQRDSNEQREIGLKIFLRTFKLSSPRKGIASWELWILDIHTTTSSTTGLCVSKMKNNLRHDPVRPTSHLQKKKLSSAKGQDVVPALARFSGVEHQKPALDSYFRMKACVGVRCRVPRGRQSNAAASWEG